MPPVHSNGIPPRGLPKGNDEVTANKRQQLLEDMVYNEMMHRSEWFRSMIDRRRDMEREFHYPGLGVQITADQYRNFYDRDSIAARVIQLMPRECFQVQPSVYEDESSENTTEFEEAVDALGEQLGEGSSWYREEKGSRIWEYLRRADELSGIGQFGIILIGIDDGLDLSMPVEGVVTKVGEKEYKDSSVTKEQVETLKALNKLNAHEVRVINHLEQVSNASAGYKHGNGPTSDAYSSSGPLFGQHPMGTDQQYFGVQFGAYGQSEQMGDTPYKGCRKLLYLRAFDESLVQIVRWESDQSNPRFNRPVMYRVTLSDPRVSHTGVGMPLATVFVHWSRVIHLADNLGSSEIMGVPRMQPVLNDIIASYKTRHAGAEGYWRGAIPGLKFSTHPSLGGDVDVNVTELKNTAENYQESLQRMLYGVGGSWETIAPVFADPTPVHNLAIECICIQLGCPVRIFKGSERGELASSQDDAQWNDRIMSRQWTYITPRIIIPLFDRLILMGVLPEPCQEVEERKSGMDLPSLPEDAGATTEEALEEGAEPTAEPPTPKKKFPPQFSTNRRPVGVIYPVRRKKKVYIRNEETGEVTEKVVTEKANAVRTAKGYVVEWPELDSMTLMDKAKYAQTMTASLAAFVGGGCESFVTRKNYFTKYELRDDDEAEAMVCDAEEQAIQDEEEAALKAAEQGLEVDPNDPTAVVDPDALPPGVTEVDEDGNPTIPKGTAPAPSFAKKGPPVPPGEGGFPPKKGKPPVGNTSTEHELDDVIGQLLNTLTENEAIDYTKGSWITVSGAHVFIKDGETKEEAVNKFLKQKEENARLIKLLEQQKTTKKGGKSKETTKEDKPAEKKLEPKKEEVKKESIPTKPVGKFKQDPKDTAQREKARAAPFKSIEETDKALAKGMKLPTGIDMKTAERAVLDYTGPKHFDRVNKELRSGKSVEDLEPKSMRDLNKLAEQPLAKPAFVYRGVSAERAEKILEGIKPGGSITFKGFVSTSLNPTVAMDFSRGQGKKGSYHAKGATTVIEIRAKTGLPVGKFGEFADEWEVVQAHGTKYRYVGTKKDAKVQGFTMNVIQLEEI